MLIKTSARNLVEATIYLIMQISNSVLLLLNFARTALQLIRVAPPLGHLLAAMRHFSPSDETNIRWT